MKELVFLQEEQALTTSLKIAEYFGKRHDRVLRAITASIQALPKNGVSEKAFIKASYTDSTGKSNRMYYLNRDGFVFVTMGFTGDKAAQLKWSYIQAFNAMEKKIIQLIADRKTAEWLEARKLSKVELRRLTDVIKDRLIPQMQAAGCSPTALKYVYKNYVAMIQKLLGIKNGTRDSLPPSLLYELGKVEDMAVTIIKGLLAKGTNYKQIYLDTKTKINSYAQLSLFNQRFIDC